MPAVSPTLLAVLTIGVVALILGILIGSYTIAPMTNDNKAKLDLLKGFSENRYTGADDQIIRHIIEGADSEKLRDNLKFLSSEPHLVGTVRDKQLAEIIRDRFLEYGLDRAYLVPYNVLLSYPNASQPNKVYLIDGKNSILFESQHREMPMRDGEMDTNFVDSYNSFAPKADVIGDPVFCNYGRQSDFDLLHKYGIDLNGKICIIRYGKIFRGNKCENAAQRGCLGVILYSDPLEMAREGTEQQDLYPNSWWMNGKAMQRGNLRTGMGDALTQGFPALVDGAFQYQLNDINLPKIPAQPIGYDDALAIMRLMSGIPVPTTSEFLDWKGGLNITYRLGPGFREQGGKVLLRLVVNNVLQQKIIYNVIGILDGSVEADRYVIVGNHRDAWGYGAIDASTGTAAMLETSRLFGSYRRQYDWRPRRTLVFASWTGEELGLIGSTEWVEQHLNLLSQKAVAYINVDYCVKGPHLSPDASPSLMEIIREITEYIPYGNQTLLDAWVQYQTHIYGQLDEPKIPTLGSGTDHAPFAFLAGIPAINIEFTFDKKKYPISGYPAYHTGYETFYLVEKFIDPDFQIHKTCSQLIGALMHAIAGSTLIPYRIDELAHRVLIDYQTIWRTNNNNNNQNNDQQNQYQFILRSELSTAENKPLIDMLEQSLADFVKAAKDWRQQLMGLDLNNPFLVRQMNDMLMSVERTFIKPDGLHERPEIRNMLFAPFKYNKYSTVVFPGMLDLMMKISEQHKTDPSKVPQLWLLFRRHVSDVAIALKSATNLLNTRPL